MFYQNNSATLHTDLEILDKDFVLIGEEEYKEIEKKNNYILNDAKILTEEEYKAELEKLKPQLATKK